MSRDIIFLIEDILKAIDEIFEFVNDITDLNQFKNDVLRKRAKNSESPAVKSFPSDPSKTR